MCVTNIYTDMYPDGSVRQYRPTDFCQYSSQGRPCPTLSKIEHQPRKITPGEITSEDMFRRTYVHPQRRPNTPPRSTSSHHRHSSAGSGHRHRYSKRSPSPLKSTRKHRKERIMIVEAPPTPRTPPQLFNQTFTAPSSPASPAYRSHERERGRPIIVDERSFRRMPSVGARVSPRRSDSRSRHVMWDSPSTSHTSFNSRLRREQEQVEIQQRIRIEEEAKEAAKERERESIRRHNIRMAEIEAERRKQAAIRAQDEMINRRPVVPLVPVLVRRNTIRPVLVDQVDTLPYMMGGLSLGESERTRSRRERDDQEAMKQRLRERQLPARRASVGPGYRRHRVAYDDGMYRWE